MEVIQYSNLLFINHQPDRYYLIDTTKKSVKAINQNCFDLIKGLFALRQDLKELL
jgi:hypothetical protein